MARCDATDKAAVSAHVHGDSDCMRARLAIRPETIGPLSAFWQLAVAESIGSAPKVTGETILYFEISVDLDSPVKTDIERSEALALGSPVCFCRLGRLGYSRISRHCIFTYSQIT